MLRVVVVLQVYKQVVVSLGRNVEAADCTRILIKLLAGGFPLVLGLRGCILHLHVLLEVELVAGWRRSLRTVLHVHLVVGVLGWVGVVVFIEHGVSRLHLIVVTF